MLGVMLIAPTVIVFGVGYRLSAAFSDLSVLLQYFHADA
jgi:hypothetical protein